MQYRRPEACSLILSPTDAGRLRAVTTGRNAVVVMPPV